MSSQESPRVEFAVDQRLIVPETRFEVIDGKIEYVSPSDEPHGSRHSKVIGMLEACVAEDYDVACDMLTRTSTLDDMAPDASIFPRERDPITGGRQLEELVFEVLVTERLNEATVKARKLSARGVRRIFAIDVSRQRGFEWSREVDSFQILAPGTQIDDRVLAAPLSLDALVYAVKADDAMAQALLAKGNPIIETAVSTSRAEGKAEGKAEGVAEGRSRAKAEFVILLLRSRGLVITESERDQILSTRAETTLDAWFAQAATCSNVSDLLSGRQK